MSKIKYTMIRALPETREALVELKRGRDTFDDVIQRLIEEHKKTHLHNIYKPKAFRVL